MPKSGFPICMCKLLRGKDPDVTPNTNLATDNRRRQNRLCFRIKPEVRTRPLLRVLSCWHCSYLYWTNFSPRSASIWRAGLDGGYQQRVVTNSLQRPVSLALDPSQGKIYWLDAGSKTIESARLDGSRRHMVARDISRRPFGLAIYQVGAFPIFSEGDSHNFEVQSLEFCSLGPIS